MDIEIRDQEIDVEKIMQQIRDNIEKKKAQGVYSDEELEWVKGLDHKVKPPVDQSDQNFLEQLRQMNLNYDLKYSIPILSHRKVMGPVIILAKKILRKLTNPYIKLIFREQVEFNAATTRVINQLSDRLAGMEGQNNNLVKNYQDLADKVNLWNTELKKELNQLRQEHDQLLDKVNLWNTELKKELNQLRQEHDQLLDKVNLWNGELRQAYANIQQEHTELAKHHQELFNKVDLWNAEIRQHHQHLVDRVDTWNEGFREEIVQLRERHITLYHKYTALQQENVLLKRRLDTILSELRQKTSLDPETIHSLSIHQERLMDHAYFLFEHTYRGLPEEIKERFRVYLPYLSNVSDILDIGCGRGEFLELMREQGISAKGIDVSEDMIYYCRQKQLSVEQREALEYLSSTPDNSLGGIFVAQLLEHLPVSTLQRFIKLCYQKMRPGAIFIAETINPLSLVAAIRNFYLDLSHIRPLHPEAFRFLIESLGFREVQVIFLSPFPPELILQKLASLNGGGKEVQRLIEVLNRNIDQLNELIYGYQDYAVIAKRG
jgi:O-antigen chain-terminating methyltransferase